MSTNAAILPTGELGSAVDLRRWLIVTATGLAIVALSLAGLRLMYAQQAALVPTTTAIRIR